MNELEKLNEKVASAYLELSLAIKEIRDIREKNGLPRVDYDVALTGLVDMLDNYGKEETRAYLKDMLSQDEEALAVWAYNKKTDERMRCFTISRKEIEEEIREKVTNELTINGIDAEIEYIVIVGSRSRDEYLSSVADLDVFVQYKADISEDKMKNLFDTAFKDYEIEGARVDIMPLGNTRNIASCLSDMETYLASKETMYQREMAADIYRLYGGSFGYENIKAAINAPADDVRSKSLIKELTSVHESAEKENPFSFWALKTGEYLRVLSLKAKREHFREDALDVREKEEETKVKGRGGR